MLLGREREAERIDRSLDSAGAGVATALVIEGEAGIGKTALLDYAVERASGMTVVRIRALQSEAELAFAGLADLCRPLLAFLDALPERQARALRSALALGPATGTPGDRLTTGAATLSLLAAAAEDRPLLLVVDDANWLDAPSAGAILFAARRLQADPVALLIAARAGDPALAARLEQLEVRGLDQDAARALLAEAAPGDLAPAVGEKLIESTRGNPLALLELPRTLTDAQLRGEEPLDDPLRVGPNVERAFAHRVTRLGEEVRRALLLAAAADNDDVRPVVTGLERLSLDQSVLEAAEDARLLHIDGTRVMFPHPLVRSAVYYGAAPSERRRAHGLLADALAGVDEERRAWHRAAAAVGPDEEAARLLEAAGARSRERGAYASAAAALERAARLGHVPRRLARLALAADAAWLAGDAPAAAALATEGLEGEPAREDRAELVALRARVELHCGSQKRAYNWFIEAADLVEPTNPRRAAEMVAEAIGAGMQAAGPELQQAAERLERLSRLLRRGDPFVEVVLAQALVAAASVAGTGDKVARLRESHAAALENGAAVAESPLHLYLAARGQWMLGRNAEASVLAREGVRRAREEQAAGVLPQLLRILAAADYDRGEWTTARAAAVEAAEVANELGQTTTACACLGLLAEMEAEIGDAAACRANARRAIEIARNFALEFYRERAERALGRLELACGSLDRAIDQLEKVAERLDGAGNCELNVSPLPDLVEAYTRHSDVPQAERALARLEALADSPMPGEEAVVNRCRGIVARNGDFAAYFRRALELHEADLFPFERARTELCLGERLRRAGERRAARQHLNSAAATFAELGAEPWLDRAHRELRATGERLRGRAPHEADVLTAREAQIAAQVAEGKSNREVAAALYLTPKTVEFHLTRVYRKLGMRSRSELVRMMRERVT